MVNQDIVDALLRDFPNLSRTIATYLVALDEQDPKFLQREQAGRLTGAEKRAFKPLPAAKVEKLAQVLAPCPPAGQILEVLEVPAASIS